MKTPLSDDEALDQALARALVPPALPSGFRGRLMAALTRADQTDLEARRRMLEREHRELQQVLASDSVRLRWRTLGYLIGGAFVAGIGAAIGMPWIRATFGANSDYVLVLMWVGLGLAVGGISWVRRNGAPEWLP